MNDPDYTFSELAESVGVNPHKGFYKFSEIAKLFGWSLATLRKAPAGKFKLPFDLFLRGEIYVVRRSDLVEFHASMRETRIPACAETKTLFFRGGTSYPQFQRDGVFLPRTRSTRSMR